MKRTIIILALLWSSMNLMAKVAPYKYFIAFKDKADSPFSVTRPQEFLSDRAIDRRVRQGIAVVEEDIPVNGSYIDAVRNLGATVLTVSKWFNGITVYLSDTTLIAQIESLPFVEVTVKSAGGPVGGDDKFGTEQRSLTPIIPGKVPLNAVGASAYNYGASFNQVHMVKGDLLHEMGYSGEGKVIAILDGGFYMANTLPAFDSLHINNQILGTKDFVSPGNDVYNESPHGMEVLSIMGGNVPGALIGTAPKAGYWLLRSEDVNSEYLVEEYNWVSAAEFADSAGADIINSSLGYTTFDDPSMDHTCADMNGNTTPVTRGANIAASKGLIVVNSAGNSGGSSWKCVGAPSDAFGAMAIAAVDSIGNYAAFSSTGSLDGRVKPNIAAQGRATVLSAPDGSISRGNGTSFSSPVIAGMVACLWQALPDLSQSDIVRAIEISGSQANDPDSLLGYGIPDFAVALTRAGENLEVLTQRFADVFPVPFSDRLTIRLFSGWDSEFSVAIYDLTGNCVYGPVNFPVDMSTHPVEIKPLHTLFPGCYLVKVTGNEQTIVKRVIKLIQR